jgi:PilZ domain
MSNDNQIVERRRSPRRTAFMAAWISHPRITQHLRCIVRSISSDGAHLEFPHAKDLPLSFWLRLAGDTELRLCTVAWRTEREMGVEFSQHIIERGAERRVAALLGREVNL